MTMRLCTFLLVCLSLLGARADRGLLQASAPSSSVTPANTSLPDLTATQAIAMLCARDVTSVEYVQALFNRYDSGGFECLNAFVSLNRTKVLADAAAVDAKAARGETITPLCGLPLAVKDTIDVEGYPTTAATPGLANAFPDFSAPLIDNYIAMNGIILGKMNLAELSSTITSIQPNSDACATIPAGGGCSTPLNAYNQTRMSGGSSAGSAASTAARFAPWSLCEDTGGSCRAPAMANGIYGLRPTLGCYNYSDALVLATFTRDTVGSFGRTMEDLVLLDSFMRTPNATTDELGALPAPVQCNADVDRSMNLTGLRLGLPSNFGWVNPGLSGEVTNITNYALDLLTQAGVELVPFDSQALNDVSADAWGTGTESYAFEDTDTLARYLYRHNYSISVPEVYYQVNRPDLNALYVDQLTQRDFSRQGSTDLWVKYLTTERPQIVSTWNEHFEQYNVSAFLYPGFTTTMPEIDATEPYVKYQNGSVINLALTNYFEIDAQAVITALAFPIGLDSTGQPYGLQMAAPAGQDGLLMSIGLQLERLFGTLAPPPTVAGCKGCASNVFTTNVTYSGVGAPADTDVWTMFGLTFNGTCASSLLSSYGQSGVLGMGPGNMTAQRATAG